MVVLRYAFVLWASFFLGSATSAETIGDTGSDLELSGTISVDSKTFILAKNLTLRADFRLILNGNELFLLATEDLTAEAGATILAFDYHAENSIASIPPPGPRPRGIAQPSWNPGPATQGNPNGDGRTGGSIVGVARVPIAGVDGRTPSKITIGVQGKAIGKLVVISEGTNGQNGAFGARGWTGGSGEQGRIGRTGAGCEAGGARGGNGGNGGVGDFGGDGGDAGAGGEVYVGIKEKSDDFEVVYSVAAGERGAPGVPGAGGWPGLFGCGGKMKGFCTTQVPIRLGFFGRVGDTGKYGVPGKFTHSNSSKFEKEGEFLETIQPSRLQTVNKLCGVDLGLSDEQEEAIDKAQLFVFWALVAEHVFPGSDIEKVVGEEGGAPSLLITPVSESGPLSFIDPVWLVHYIENPPPEPAFGTITSGYCNNCCDPTPAVGCLQHRRWRFTTDLMGNRRYGRRTEWQNHFQDLLQIEASKESVIGSEEFNPEPWAVYVTYNHPYQEKVAYLKLGPNLFSRLVMTLSPLVPSIRAATDAKVNLYNNSMICTNNRVVSIGTSETISRLRDENGFGFATRYSIVSSKSGVELHELGDRKKFFVMPIHHGRNLTEIGEVEIFSTDYEGWTPEEAGFRRGSFCRMYASDVSHPNERLLSCNPSMKPLIRLVYENWRAFDVPSVILTLHSLVYIDAMVQSEGLDIASGAAGSNLALHCFDRKEF